MRLAVLALCLLGLAACVGGGGAKAPAAAANPITGGEVSVSALAPPPGAASAAQPATPAASKPAEAATPPVPPPGAKAPGGNVSVAIPPSSPEEAACRKEGGSWSKVGKGGRACLKATRDSGKSCSSGRDCEGLCLARSGTCAPLKPMFGCNEIFQDDGQKVTLCID